MFHRRATWICDSQGDVCERGGTNGIPLHPPSSHRTIASWHTGAFGKFGVCHSTTCCARADRGTESARNSNTPSRIASFGSNLHSNRHTNGTGSLNTSSHSGTNSHGNPNVHADGNGYGNTDAYTNTHTVTNSHGNPNLHANGYRNTDAHTNPHADTNSNCHRNTDIAVSLYALRRDILRG